MDQRIRAPLQPAGPQGVTLWALLALLTALCESGKDLLTRRLLRHGGLSSRLVMGAACLVSALLALPLTLAALGRGVAPDPIPLLLSLLATALVNGLAFWSYGRALARGDLSLVLPLINLSPVVLLLSGWLMLGERPTPLALVGVLLLVMGALELGRSGPGAAGLWGQPGARAMLLVALLWGIGAGIDKLGVRAAGTLTWVTTFNLVVGLPLLLPALAAGEGEGLRRHWPWLLLLGLVGAAGMGLQMEALRRTAVVHVIAIKRLSTLFSALAGVIWLGENGGTLRLPAAAVMLIGAVMVLRFGRG